MFSIGQFYNELLILGLNVEIYECEAVDFTIRRKWKKGNINNINKEPNIATTPSNFSSDTKLIGKFGDKILYFKKC